MVTPDHPNGIYREGETIHWQVKVNTNPAAGGGTDAVSSLSYVVKRGGFSPIANGTIPLDHGVGTLTATLPEAGTLPATTEAGTLCL